MKSFPVLFLFLFFSQISAHSFSLPSGRTECFYETFETEKQVDFDFQVLNGINQYVNLKVRSPQRVLMYNKQRTETEKFSFTPHSTNPYSFCFENIISSHHKKEINFNLYQSIAPSYRNLEKEGKEKTPLEIDNILLLGECTIGLSEKFEEIKELVKYLKIRETVHRNTTESTNARVLLWSTFQLVLLTIASFVQIWVIKRRFEKKHFV
ncbi:hypothetical protein M0812_18046 [Anaeramoeba flamelloides]|uniref:GOLD domain-containing protein n=1 Tax=Anaeramoeba flamelloides TaxID=1746091 RepID=A0AAV7Z296_9EUKA|nr:hypothetical protein M0812_18046 [Anaeramoeba flamelloides]